MKIFFTITLILLSSIPIKCQITDFTLFPEDAETPGMESIFKDMLPTEKILAAVQFGNTQLTTVSEDLRNNLAWARVNNVINFNFLKT